MSEEIHPIDRMSDAEIFSEMVSFFGPKRVTELFGWVFIAAVFTWSDPVSLRVQLEQKGLTGHSLYRALRDLRRFGEHLEGKPLPARDTATAVKILRRAIAMQPLCLSSS